MNGGDLLRRWTNDRFLATPHRVFNRSGQERYAIPLFFDCNSEQIGRRNRDRNLFACAEWVHCQLV